MGPTTIIWDYTASGWPGNDDMNKSLNKSLNKGPGGNIHAGLRRAA